MEADAGGTSERVLITGASGFIGTSLVDRLLADGHEVFAVVRSGTPERAGSRGLTTLHCDLRCRTDIDRVVAAASPTLSFHLAWRAEPVEYLTSIPWNFESVRFGLAFVETLLKAGCRRIVCAGSCAEYELGPDRLREDSPARPGTLYGAAKLALGTAVTAAATQMDVNLAWARIFYVYGPHENPRRAVPRIVCEALEGRRSSAWSPQHRDFLHVHDVATALAALGRHGAHGPVNICSAQATSLREIDSLVRGILDDRDVPPPRRTTIAICRRGSWRTAIICHRLSAMPRH